MDKSLDRAPLHEHPYDHAELDGLRRRHDELKRRLAVLDGHLSLTSAEQTERARIKKEKLLVKDRILLLTARAAGGTAH